MDSVADFLASVGLGDKAQAFKDADIDDMETLRGLTKEELREFVSLGTATKILKALAAPAAYTGASSGTAATLAATVAPSSELPYENPGRKPMVGFNAGTAMEDAVALTKFLGENGFPTFCTGVKYGGGFAGGQNWQRDTNEGATQCSAFIPLMTGKMGEDKKGWQLSGETQQEFQLVFKRWTKNHQRYPLIIPVVYKSFDEAYDTLSHQNWMQNLQCCQQVKRDDADWMQQILTALENNAREAWSRPMRSIDNLSQQLGVLDWRGAQATEKYIQDDLNSMWIGSQEDLDRRCDMLSRLEAVMKGFKLSRGTVIPPGGIHHWLFLGNPGVGKSTVANGWLYALTGDRAAHFRSGLSAGSGLTEELQWQAEGFHKVADIPGLNDSDRREKAAKAIENALKMDGNYTLCFLCLNKAGRISPEDVMVIKAVLDAAPTISAYIVLMNKVKPQEFKFFHEGDNMARMLSQFSSLRIPPANVAFMMEDEALVCEQDFVPELPEEVKEVLRNLGCIHIAKESVTPLDVTGWEAKERSLKEAHERKLTQRVEELRAEYEENMKEMERKLAADQQTAEIMATKDVKEQLRIAREAASRERNPSERKSKQEVARTLEATLQNYLDGWYVHIFFEGRNLAADVDFQGVRSVADLESRITRVLQRPEPGGDVYSDWHYEMELNFQDKTLDCDFDLQSINYVGSVIRVRWNRVSVFDPNFADGRLYLVDGTEEHAQASWNSRAGHWARSEALEADPAPEDFTPEVASAASHHWMQAGLREHASLASFSRASLNLLRFGAPPELLAATHRAAADEVGHAELDFGLAKLFRGRPDDQVNVHRFPVASVDLCPSLNAFSLQVFEEGCVNESLSVLLIVYALPSLDPKSPVHAAMSQLLLDETRHSALAWRTAQWAAGCGACPGIGQPSDDDPQALTESIDERWRGTLLASWCGVVPGAISAQVAAVAKHVWIWPWFEALCRGGASLPSIKAPAGPIGAAILEAESRIRIEIGKLMPSGLNKLAEN